MAADFDVWPQTHRMSGEFMAQIMKILNGLTTCLIIILLVGGPWAFGSTTSQVVRIANWIAYALGIILFVKVFLRSGLGSRQRPVNAAGTAGAGAGRWTVKCVLLLMMVILAYACIAGLNARVVYEQTQDGLTAAYREVVAWLPHSYDAGATWSTFRVYLGLCCLFWALYDWLRDVPEDERRWGWGNRRFTLVMWVLSINGLLLSLEGILQRLADSPKLLFLVEPHINKSSLCHFGPYAYRSNGAQYLNLLWPCCLGFWWLLRDRLRSSNRILKLGQGSHMIVFLAVLVMLSGVFVSVSRGGMAVGFGQLILCMLVFRKAGGVQQRITNHQWITLLVMGIVVAAACLLVKDQIRIRMEWDPTLGGREEIYRNAGKILLDFPLFGAGPGSFATIYEQYTESVNEQWHAYLHDDWRQTLVEWGWLGAVPIFALMILLTFSGVVNRKSSLPFPFILFTMVGCFGCLIHAKVDFPMQIHSILVLYVVLASLLFALGGRSFSPVAGDSSLKS